ncbi:MAG: HAD-IB family hydrolase [Gammaproteobacteria bacterium]|nr:HAD-IB family hydrolase [Gammaproteobacteria bacterium]
MRLAVFDLDNTLLSGDSDYLWGQFLADGGYVDADQYAHANRRFYEQYLAGELDIAEFAAFSLRPLVELGAPSLAALRPRFVQDKIAPIVSEQAYALLERHRADGDTLLITTATSRFITEPIAELLGVEHLIATDPEVIDGVYTGRIAGTPNFQGGKCIRLRQWIKAAAAPVTHMTAYSDSRNDVPLLEMADVQIAVDPDPVLRDIAAARGWPIISLRSPSAATR